MRNVCCFVPQLEWPEEAADAPKASGTWQPMAATGQQVVKGDAAPGTFTCSPLLMGGAAAGVLAVAMCLAYMASLA